MILEAAAEIYYRFEKSAKFLDEVFVDFTKDCLDRDKPKIRELVYRAVTWKGSLEQVLKIYSDIKLEKLEPHLRAILIVALAEFLFDADKIPARVINNAVEVIHSQSRKKFANAVLRKISSKINKINVSEKDVFSRNCIGAFKFKDNIFADPVKKPAQFLSQAFSIPRFLSELFLSEFNLSRAVEILRESNINAPFFLRINTSKISTDHAFENLTAAGFDLENTSLPFVFKLKKRMPIIETEMFQKGLFYIQDLSAVEASLIDHLELPSNPGILDGCAAPGGKLTFIYEQLKGEGEFTAVEVNPNKLHLIEENIKRLGHTKIKIVNSDFIKFAEKTKDKFDLVLLDVPCSNLGVLARKPDVRWRLKPEDLESLTKLQDELLQAGSKLVAPKGYLIYSTCTLLRTENEERIKEFLKNNPEYKLIEEKLWLPEISDRLGAYRAIHQKQ